MKQRLFLYLTLITLLLFCIKQLFSIRSQSESQSSYYKERIDLFEKLSYSKPQVIFVGDSLTDNAEWHEIFPNITIGNRGIQGDTVQGLHDRISNITKTKAEKVFLMIGINDLMRNHSVDSILKIQHEIISVLSRKHQHLYIQSVIYTRNQDIEINNKITLINRSLEDFSHQFKNATFINLNQHLAEKNELKAEYTIDGIHLNGSGYSKWKEIIDQFIY